MTLTLTRPTAESAVVAARCEASPITLEFRPGNDRCAVMNLWRELQGRLPSVAVACSVDWVECWLNHYHDIIPHQFVIARRGETVCAVLLITHDVNHLRSWLPTRTLHFGTAGEPDSDSVCIEYNDWLCAPEDKDAVLTALLTGHSPPLAGDRWLFDGFSTWDLPQKVASENGWLCEQKLARYCDLRQVRESGRELITFFGDSTRKALRQNLRDYGSVDVDWGQSAQQAQILFDELVALHQARWNAVGEPGCYASARFTAFHRELIERLVPTGQMAIVRVRAGGTTLGCTQLLIDRGRALVYQGGRLSNSNKHSPGLVTDYLCMQECLRRGYLAFDFMAGDSIHKQRLSTHSVPLVWAERRLPGWKLPVLDGLRSLKRAVRLWVARNTNHAGPRASVRKD